MTKTLLFSAMVMAGSVFLVSSAFTQDSTPPPTIAEKEAVYATAIENRTADILKLLALTDPAKSNRVHDIVISQYRALRARDEAIDAVLGDLTKGSPEWKNERAAMLPGMSKPLHDRFLARLSAVLSPDEVEKVKDKMTYGKVAFTYDAYCAIVPGLTEEHKAKVMELLKQARDEAIDGGNTAEKSTIFQKYKDQINAYLTAQGHDVAKAYAEWNAKQELAKKAKAESTSPAVQQ